MNDRGRRSALAGLLFQGPPTALSIEVEGIRPVDRAVRRFAAWQLAISETKLAFHFAPSSLATKSQFLRPTTRPRSDDAGALLLLGSELDLAGPVDPSPVFAIGQVSAAP